MLPILLASVLLWDASMPQTGAGGVLRLLAFRAPNQGYRPVIADLRLMLFVSGNRLLGSPIGRGSPVEVHCWRTKSDSDSISIALIAWCGSSPEPCKEARVHDD